MCSSVCLCVCVGGEGVKMIHERIFVNVEWHERPRP